MRGTSAACVALLLLCFTGAGDARAEPARWTGGHASARLGSTVGTSELGEATVNTLGVQAAAGMRLGLFALEVEYGAMSMLEYEEDRSGNDVRGDLQRLGVNARAYLVTLAWPGSADPDSLLHLYTEAGLGRQYGRWTTGDRFARNDVALGAGWLLDHRMEPRWAGLGFRSVGWHFGWQLLTSRSAGGPAVSYKPACPGCRPPPMPGPELEVGLQVSCSIAASW